MEDYIILAIVAVASTLGVIYTVKHFSSKGGCCGGTSRKRKKRVKCVKYKKIFAVEGMHCKNCASRLEMAIDDVKGVVCKVSLRRATATVLYSIDVDDCVITEKARKAGFQLTLK